MKNYIGAFCVLIVALITGLAVYSLLSGKIIDIPRGTWMGGLITLVCMSAILAISFLLIRIIKTIEKKFQS